MKTSDRQRKLLMNQELLIAYDDFFKNLALLLAMKSQLEGKDDLPYEDRFNDGTLEAIFQERDEILPLFDQALYDFAPLKEFLEKSGIIAPCLKKGIEMILDFRQEQNLIQESAFSPYETSLRDANRAFVERLLIVKRTNYLVSDIEEGIEQYDVASYLVPENVDSVDLLSGIKLLRFQDQINELMCHLTREDFTSEEEQENQKNQLALLLMIQKGEN